MTMADEPQEPVNTNPEVVAPPTIEELTAQLAEERRLRAEQDRDLKVYKDTLTALGSGTQTARGREDPLPGAAPPSPPNDADYVRELARETGYAEDQLAPYVPVIRAV